MRNTLAIAGKEIRVYLTTGTSYVLCGAFVLICAFFFQRLMVEYQLRAMQYMQTQQQGMLEQMNLTDWLVGPLFLNITIFFLFMLPVLTMHLIAEERRTKTLELLLTSPVRPVEIVAGKYLSGLFIMGIMLALTLIFPLMLQYFSSSAGQGGLDWRSVAVGYLGMFLLGAAFVAVGLCASAVSDSQIISVIAGFATLLMFYVIGLAARGQTGVWQTVLQYLAINTHLEAFVRGVIRRTDIVYFLSIVCVSLSMTWRIIEAQRWR